MHKFSLKYIRHLTIVEKVFYMRKRITLLEELLDNKEKQLKQVSNELENVQIKYLDLTNSF